MNLAQEQLNKHCEAYQNTDGVTLHTGFPGNTAANDSGIAKEALSAWPDAVTGVMSAQAVFDAVPPGDYPYAVVWDGTTPIEVLQIDFHPTTTMPLTVVVEHHAKERV